MASCPKRCLILTAVTKTVAILAVGTVLAACSGTPAQPPSPSLETGATTVLATTATVVATPSATAVPAVGVPVVDAFVKAMLTGDSTALAALIDYRDVPCSVDQQGIGAPPACPPGAPDRTPIKAISGSSCEGYYITEAEMPRILAGFRSRGALLFSASRLPQGGYAIVFTFARYADGAPATEPRNGTVYLLSERGVTSWHSGCGWSARTSASHYPDYLIPPPPLPPVPADTPHTGITDVDSIIDALVIRDTPALARRVASIDVGCGTDRWLPYCPWATAPGTLVSSIALQTCEPSWIGIGSGNEPYGVAVMIDGEIGPEPKVVTVARATGSDTDLRYWIIYDGSVVPGQQDGGRAFGLRADGRIALFDRGCNETAAQIAGRYSDFLVRPK